MAMLLCKIAIIALGLAASPFAMTGLAGCILFMLAGSINPALSPGRLGYASREYEHDELREQAL